MERLQLETRCYGHPAAHFTAVASCFDAPARWRRALSAAGLCLLGAVLSLPVPGWHFIGVPGFLVAAFVTARGRLREHVQLHRAEGACPACAAEVELTPAGRGAPPLTLPCPACGEFLKLCDLR